MKLIYGIIGLLTISGLAFYMTSCNNKSKGNEQTTQQSQDTTQRKKVDPKDNPYKGLRDMAFNITPDQIGAKLSAHQTKIYGVIMDWDLGEGTATLVAFSSGDASLYLSSGGGVIGASGHENVKQGATTFISKAEKYLSRTTITETTPLPDKNGVKFYFLTNKGKYVGTENMKNFENKHSEWLDLFEEGNKLITEIRNSSAGDL
jgi:hypothetical protein